MIHVKQVSRLFVCTVLTSMLLLSLGDAAYGQAVSVSGELKRWHKVTLTLDGPSSSEGDATNPFTNYRMNVTFSHPGSGLTYVVPGYFAADGNAANSSATTGNKWRAHLSPDHTGTWNYTISFRSGSNVAMDESPSAGTALAPYDGVAGNFTVGETDKTGRDHRGKGRLQYVGGHHLQFAGNGKYFLKAGADAPENFLAYQDFDGAFKTDGQGDNHIKSWSAHVGDWQAGDPVWQGTKGKGIIGAINYLASEGLNAFSFLTMNINGDDKNVFPYTTYGERYRIDCSRMDQWEMVLEHGDKLGMYLHFKTMETENELLLDSGNLGNQRKLYYRELIARFGHHLALNWNLGEEINNASTAQKTAWAQYFYDHDPYHHHIVIHNGDNHYEMMGNASKLTGFSLQTNNDNFSNVRPNTKNYIDRSVTAGKPWVVACDEPGDAQHALRPDYDAGSSHVNGRKNALWGNMIVGGAGVEFYFGYSHDHSDLSCQDWRSRNAFWDYCRYALQFFEDNEVPFWEMSSQDGLVGSGYCLAKPGEVYVVQLPNGGTTTLNLTGQSGSFPVQWYNPRTGGALQDGSVTSVTGGGTVSLGTAPGTTGDDWIVLVGLNAAFTVDAGPDQSVFLASGQTEVQVDLDGTVEAPEGVAYGVTWSLVSGPGTASFGDSHAVDTTATLTGPAGDYELQLYGRTSLGEIRIDTMIVTLDADTQAPTVVIDTPADGARFPQDAVIAVNATVTDDVAVKEVQLLVDGLVDQTDTNAPYAFTLTGLAPGMHTLGIKGIDTSDNMATETVLIEVAAGVDGAPPSVTITSPADGADFLEGAAIAVSATITDDFAVAEAQFLVDGAYQETDATAPYAFTAEGLTVGSYSLAVIGVDSSGNRATNSVSVDVLPYDPTFAVDAGPNQNVVLPQGGSLITVNLNGTVTAQPSTVYTSEWTKISGPGIVTFGDAADEDSSVQLVGAGTYVLQLAAEADTGQADDDTVTIQVDPYSSTFTEMYSPVEDAYTENGSNNNNADLKVQPDFRISYLKFDVNSLPENAEVTGVTLDLTEGGDPGNGTLRFHRGAHNTWAEGTITGANAPGTAGEVGVRAGAVSGGQTISVDVTPLVESNGIYTVIIMMDAGGNDIWFHSSESSPAPKLTVTGDVPDVTPDTNAPVVVIDRPIDRSTWPLGAEVDVEATIIDDRSVAEARMYLDSVEQATDLVAPFAWTLSGVTQGTHQITVIGWDEAGNSGTASVLFAISETPDTQDPEVTITAPVDGTEYEDGDLVPVTATVSDDYSVSEVQLWVDGILRDTDTTAPYSFIAEMVGVGPHTLMVRGIDGSGNVGSASVEVTAVQVVYGLRAHYEFEGDAVDSTGNGFDGTARGGVGFAVGFGGGQALALDGIDDDVVIPPVVNKDFTIAFWMSTSTSQGGGAGPWHAGVGLVDGDVSGEVADLGVTLTEQTIAFGVGAPDTTIESASGVTDGGWHHVAVTRDNATGAMILYVDGVQEATQTGPAGARINPSLHLGSLQTDGNHFQGMLDDVRIYNEVLDAGEISVLAGTAIIIHQDGSYLPGAMVLQYFGDDGKEVVFEMSPDLQAWSTLATGLVSGGVFTHYDRQARNQARRFYRLATEADLPTGETIVYQAATDFANINAGDVPAYVDGARNALAIDTAALPVGDLGKFAAAERVFTGAAGTYDISLTSLTERDGECTYRVYINGALVLEGTNPRIYPSTDEYNEVDHTATGVTVPAGATIRVEFNSHTNGLVPEGDSTGYARGRWRRITFASGGAPTGAYIEQGGVVVMEIENTASPQGLWLKINPGDANYVSGATGSGHFEFTGNAPANGPPTSPLTFTFTISQAGNYALHLRARKRLAGAPSDQCNDAYVRMAGDFVSGSTHYGTGTLTQDTKLYGGNADNWGWANNLDGNGADHVPPIYTFIAGETYTLTVSGRSQRFNIDRIVLNHSSVGSGTWQSAAESPRAP